MFIGRLIIGLSCGINLIIVPIYIKEMSGRTGSFHYLFISIGIFTSSLITAFPEEYLDSINFIYIGCSFPIITCLIRIILIAKYFDYDTPKYYILSN